MCGNCHLPFFRILLEQATAINDNGQIVANSGSGSAYLLTPLATTPIPEPSTFVLFGAGFAPAGLLGFVVSRRNRST